MAANKAVSVLTPNGRRQIVKVSPNTSLLQILEEVSVKHGFNPDDYGLRFQRNLLDLSLQWRFAGLPNNAKLEVVASERRQAGTDNTVLIAVQLEDGNRLQGSFSCGQSLWDLLSHFPQLSISDEDEDSTPTCVYMRDEISGQQTLQKTTLKSLGLTGGSAIIRYMLKKPKRTEDGSSSETAVLPVDGVKMESSGNPTAHSTLPRPSADTVADLEGKQSAPDLERKQLPDEPTTSRGCQISSQTSAHCTFVPFSGGGQCLGGAACSSTSVSSVGITGGPPEAKKPKPSHEIKNPACVKASNAQGLSRKEADMEGEAEEADRQTLVYHMDGGVSVDGNQDLPDEFFEVTMDDVRKRFSQLKSERKLLEEAPLMTQALREAKMKEKVERYPIVVLRVQFPDRHILQGFFRPMEKVSALKQFVKTQLEDPNLNFYLFTTPPKSILKDSATLFQANLFPAALVYFGSDVKTDCFLRRDVLEIGVTAQEADERVAGCIAKSAVPMSASLTPEDPQDYSLPAMSSAANSHQEAELPPPAPKPVTTDPSKVPKWLKLPGKK